ncbi:MAG: class I SAM-dependent methyltransferase [Planctomycetaceae bacterium]|nr:class I SAM-dependent methyltransferase [Planctomycetales bacterium]MCB9925092.1 class I SAM-dependent methyltransferase [Planctomycetaceae bacterium]
MTNVEHYDAEHYEPGVSRVFQTKDETRAFYDKIARVYDLLAERSEQPMREAGLRMLAAQSNERILEIGYGTGHCIVDLAKAVGPDGEVWGIDLSQNMQGIAQQLAEREGLADRVRLDCGDAAHLPYESESVDGIFTSFTLELFDTPDLPSVLTEWRRVLRTSGRLVVVGLSKEGRQGLVMKAYEWTHKHFPNLMDCRPIFVSRALEAAGFTIADQSIEHMWVAVEVVKGVKGT